MITNQNQMTQFNLFQITYSFLIITILSTSCNKTKKDDNPSPDVVFRPKKIEVNGDKIESLDIEYDTYGRVSKRTINYKSSSDYYQIFKNLTQVITYLPNKIIQNNSILSSSDNKLYTCGYDSTFLDSDANPIKSNAFYSYSNAALLNIDTIGVFQSKKFVYSFINNIKKTTITTSGFQSGIESIYFYPDNNPYLGGTFIENSGDLPTITYADFEGYFQDKYIQTLFKGVHNFKQSRLPKKWNNYILGNNPTKMISYSTSEINWTLDDLKRPIEMYLYTSDSLGQNQILHSHLKFEY
ncbi:MAG: hypothetical protein K2Q22_07095 [Cytophagales bacterium]|nr:hypothetical protein [Cytophagales bacterium]